MMWGNLPPKQVSLERRMSRFISIAIPHIPETQFPNPITGATKNLVCDAITTT